MMRELRLLGLFVVVSTLGCFSQSSSDPLSQVPGSQVTTVYCSDPAMANDPQCSSRQGQTSTGGGNSSAPTRIPTLTPPAGVNTEQYTPSAPPPNPSQIARPQMP